MKREYKLCFYLGVGGREVPDHSDVIDRTRQQVPAACRGKGGGDKTKSNFPRCQTKNRHHLVNTHAWPPFAPPLRGFV